MSGSRPNFERLLLGLPDYQENLELGLLRLAEQFDLDEIPNWEGIAAFASEQIRPRTVLRRAVAVFSDIGGQAALVVLYATLLLVERLRFVRKIFQEPGRPGA